MTLTEISKVLENTGYMTTIDEDKFIKAGIKTTSRIMPGLNIPKEVFYISLYKKNNRVDLPVLPGGYPEGV